MESVAVKQVDNQTVTYIDNNTKAINSTRIIVSPLMASVIKSRKKNWKCKEVLYQIKNKNDEVVTTTCLLFGENGNLISRGVAIRSLIENKEPTTGMDKARGRAIKAMIRKKSSGPVRRAEAYKALQTAVTDDPMDVRFLVKSEYNPEMTPLELTILHKM